MTNKQPAQPAHSDDLCINLFCFHKRDYHQPDCRFSACNCKVFQDAPTEAEAETALREAGVDPKDVVNGFIERLLEENAKLRAAATPREEAPMQIMTPEIQQAIQYLIAYATSEENANEEWRHTIVGPAADRLLLLIAPPTAKEGSDG